MISIAPVLIAVQRVGVRQAEKSGEKHEKNFFKKVSKKVLTFL